MANNKLVLKNKHLPSLDDWLNQLPLGAKESRERTRFRSMISERIQEIYKVRTELLIKHAEKDEKGEPKKVIQQSKKPDGTDTSQEVYDITPANLKLYEKDFTDYLAEDYVIDALEGNKAKLKTVQGLILNSEQKLRGELADLYAEWADAFEALTLD